MKNPGTLITREEKLCRINRWIGLFYGVDVLMMKLRNFHHAFLIAKYHWLQIAATSGFIMYRGGMSEFIKMTYSLFITESRLA
jgi:hypothetical protein